MGLIDKIRSLGYQVKEVRFVDDRGRTRSSFSTGVFDRMTKGRFTSVSRSDISATIFEALDDGVRTMFGDSIKSIDDMGSRVRVAFESGSSDEFDLVIGADGLHSRVREIGVRAGESV